MNMWKRNFRTHASVLLALIVFLSGLHSSSIVQAAAIIPLPEHPRPDFQRADWVNLNGQWAFDFAVDDAGLKGEWFNGKHDFSQSITVPFSWGAKLSGVEDKGDIGWYTRTIQIPESWKGQRAFLVIGASDWRTEAWLDGKKLGEHQGGYTPFEFDLSAQAQYGKEQNLTIRVDDTPHKFKLEGKQGYGRAAGIWQTLYLESRPAVAIETVHFTPNIDDGTARVNVTFDQPVPEKSVFMLTFNKTDLKAGKISVSVVKGQAETVANIQLENPRLWSLDDPYLIEVKASLKCLDGLDEVSTYFGMRKISAGILPGTDFPYVMLNNEPIYLQLALDQSYHPDGFYTFPSDAFMRDEILRSRSIGLNGQRIHIKVEVPRKLYWADKLGILIMADVPNSWGLPDENARRETEFALRGMVKRDYNHPSIFSWVDFNETWGLFSEGHKYLPETQKWVEEMYRLTKELDATRLVEDNSPCNFDHVVTDLNSWHAYLPGYRWKEVLDEYCAKTKPGSTWNYIGGRKQGSEPMLNSECGNVWGYEGSAGDVDWSWDYHIMMNEFRRHPKMCGWLYTEHHDVINEWNGYWRFDRSEKFTGIPQLVEGMRLNDLHGKFYIASERELCRNVAPGEEVTVPLFASFMTGEKIGGDLTLSMSLSGWDTLANKRHFWNGSTSVPYQPWMNRELESVTVPMPRAPGLAILSFTLKDAGGRVLHRNFTTYRIGKDAPRTATVKVNGRGARVVRFAPDSFSKAEWTQKQWNVLDGLKVNGAGSGYFEYTVPWPEGLKAKDVLQANLKMELSAKKLFGKDIEGATTRDGDFMRGEGTHDPSSNRNSYPMTDEERFPSSVRVRVMGESAGSFDLPDDSADHRGILSWHSQKRDKFLREAGSYGYLVDAAIPSEALKKAQEEGELIIRLEVDVALPGGLAIYGENFGRYPLDPSLVFVLGD